MSFLMTLRATSSVTKQNNEDTQSNECMLTAGGNIELTEPEQFTAPHGVSLIQCSAATYTKSCWDDARRQYIALPRCCYVKPPEASVRSRRSLCTPRSCDEHSLGALGQPAEG